MKPFNVLFINTPPKTIDALDDKDITSASYIFPPMGILQMAARIYEKEYVDKVWCLDYNLFDYSGINSLELCTSFIREKLVDISKEFTPDIICLSLMFSSAYDFFKIIAKESRKLFKDAIVICGGIHVSNTADFIFDDIECIDFAMCGEGDEALACFIENIFNKNTVNIKGVHSRDNIKYDAFGILEKTDFPESINVNFEVFPQICDMETYTSRTSLFSLTQSSIKMKAFALMASRGCPVKCTFCAARTVHGTKPRWRSLENIRNEIIWLNSKYGVTKIYLMDDNFVPKQKNLELFNMFSELKIDNLDIVIQNLSVNHTDYEIIDAIAKANIKYLPIAIESGSTEMQRKIKKYCNLDKAVDLVDYAKEKGLDVRCFYIIGFPGETVEQMNETIDFAIKVGANWSSFNVAVPLPGSEMYNEFQELGYIAGTFGGEHTIRDRTFDTAEISAKDIKHLAYAANLKVNFINSPYIINKEYKKGIAVFKNFIESFDFHIFAHDCLRRIYLLTDNVTESNKHMNEMKRLINKNPKSFGFKEYLYLLDDDMQKFLTHLK